MNEFTREECNRKSQLSRNVWKHLSASEKLLSTHPLVFISSFESIFWRTLYPPISDLEVTMLSQIVMGLWEGKKLKCSSTLLHICTFLQVISPPVGSKHFVSLWYWKVEKLEAIPFHCFWVDYFCTFFNPSSSISLFTFAQPFSFG